MAIKVVGTDSSPTIQESTLAGYRGKEITDGSKGKSNTGALKSIFASPLSKNSDEGADVSSPENYKKWFLNNVLKGQTNGFNYGLGRVNMEFTDAPDLNDVETGGEGKPATPFVPNPTSPGEGIVSAANVQPAPKEFTDKLSPNGAFPPGTDTIVDNANLRNTAKIAVDNLSEILVPTK